MYKTHYLQWLSLAISLPDGHSFSSINHPEVIEKLEKNLAQITSVTELLDQGYTPEMLLEKLLGDMDLEINEKVPTSFYCNCDKVRVGKVLISLGEKELQGMIDDGEPIELNCHFCNTNYTFSVDELKELLELARK